MSLFISSVGISHPVKKAGTAHRLSVELSSVLCVTPVVSHFMCHTSCVTHLEFNQSHRMCHTACALLAWTIL